MFRALVLAVLICPSAEAYQPLPQAPDVPQAPDEFGIAGTVTDVKIVGCKCGPNCKCPPGLCPDCVTLTQSGGYDPDHTCNRCGRQVLDKSTTATGWHSHRCACGNEANSALRPSRQV